MATPSSELIYREMEREAQLVVADPHRKRRDDLIRALRADGWTLRDIARGAGISHNAVAKICAAA